jgi:hypothetical protein
VQLFFCPFGGCDTLLNVKNSIKTSRFPLTPFKTGQVWKLKDSDVHIIQVGKRLVFYKIMKPALKRAPVSLLAQSALEKYLKDNKAILAPA